MKIPHSPPTVPNFPSPGLHATNDLQPLFEKEQTWVSTSWGGVYQDLDEAIDSFEASPVKGTATLELNRMHSQTNEALVAELDAARGKLRRNGLIQGGVVAGIGAAVHALAPSSSAGTLIGVAGAAWAGFRFLSAGSAWINHFQDRYEETGISEVEHDVHTYTMNTIEDRAGKLHSTLSEPTPWESKHYFVIPDKSNPEVSKVRKFGKFGKDRYGKHYRTPEMTWSVLYDRYGNSPNEF